MESRGYSGYSAFCNCNPDPLEKIIAYILLETFLLALFFTLFAARESLSVQLLLLLLLLLCLPSRSHSRTYRSVPRPERALSDNL